MARPVQVVGRGGGDACFAAAVFHPGVIDKERIAALHETRFDGPPVGHGTGELDKRIGAGGYGGIPAVAGPLLEGAGRRFRTRDEYMVVGSGVGCRGGVTEVVVFSELGHAGIADGAGVGRAGRGLQADGFSAPTLSAVRRMAVPERVPLIVAAGRGRCKFRRCRPG